MVAHNRNIEGIAQYIGADGMIYQTLDDLKGACIEVAQENGYHEPRDFEAGVFCGKYITPVSDGYFDHLEKIRGEGRKIKAVEKAKQAVTHGIANHNDFQIATNGVKLDAGGNVVPASYPPKADVPRVESEHVQPNDENPKVKDRMDISIHNMGDY